MRLISTLAIVALAATPVVATAQTAPAAPAAPAPAYSSKSTIGALLESPDAKAVVFKYIPELAQAGDQLSQAAGFTLKDLQQYIPTVTDKMLAEMDVDLAKVPAPKKP